MPRRFKLILVGDAHFGAPTHQEDDDERRKGFIDFIEQVTHLTETLVITGDLFDFWFEYPGYVPSHYVDILDALEKATTRTRVVYLPGNHDLWVGTTIEDLGKGIEIRDSLILELGDKRLMVTHGHQFSTGILTKVINSILKNSVAVSMFRLIPPRMGYAIGRIVSRISRIRNTELGKLPFDVERFAMSLEHDVLILGHFHLPRILKTKKKAIVVAGDWMVFRNYTVITDKGVEIYDYKTNRVIGRLNLDELDTR